MSSKTFHILSSSINSNCFIVFCCISNLGIQFVHNLHILGGSRYLGRIITDENRRTTVRCCQISVPAIPTKFLKANIFLQICISSNFTRLSMLWSNPYFIFGGQNQAATHSPVFGGDKVTGKSMNNEGVSVESHQISRDKFQLTLQ